MNVNIPSLIKAITIVGGQSNLARILGVTQPTISDWVNEKSSIHPKYLKPIEKATDAVVTCENLCPSLESIEAEADNLYSQANLKQYVERLVDARVQELMSDLISH